MLTEAKCETEPPDNAQAHTGVVNGEIDDGYECWICRDSGTPEDPLITDVCLCRGSVAWVHQKCIDQWVFTQRRVNCPSCDAEYNLLSTNSTEAPGTFVGDVWLLLRKLVIPLLYKLLFILLGVAINLFAVPGVIGVVYYHQSVFGPSAGADNATWPITLNDSAPADKMASAFFPADSHTVLINSSSSSSSGETEELRGFWLWAAVLVCGWVHVAFWCSLRSAWWQWRVFFNRVQNPIEPPLPTPFTSVEYAHWALDVCHRWVQCSSKAASRRIVELSFLTPLAYVLSFPKGKIALVAVFVIVSILWRIQFPRKRIHNPVKRFVEVQERKEEASEADIMLWFGTYVCETILFSLILPICAGIVLRFSLSPFIFVMPESLTSFLAQLSLFQLIGYWVIGSTSSLVLMHMESWFIVPLFAPGVDLLFIRSVDLNIEGGTMYWSFIVAQVFDGDPFRVIVDFLRMSFIELTALYVFVATPLRVTFALHKLLNTQSAVPASQNDQILLHGNSSLDLLFASFELPSITFFGQEAFLAVWQSVCWIFENRALRWWIDGSLTACGVGTILMCLRMYPIVFMQLKVMRPVVIWLSKHFFHLDAFLFDAERQQILEHWLRGNGQGELNMPEVPLPMIFSRRERVIPPEDLPNNFNLRRLFFSIVFYVLGSTFFWVGPVIAMEVVLFFLPIGAPAVCVSVNLFFFFLNPKMYIDAVGAFLLLFLIVIATMIVQPLLFCLLIFHISREKLVQETLEYTQSVKRTVGIYRKTRDEEEEEEEEEGQEEGREEEEEGQEEEEEGQEEEEFDATH